MTIQSLEQLRDEFLQEAKSAPKLFKDLAKVEQYIAESYKTRALIELIQNADDAASTSFGLHSIEGGFIVGNNGRTFSSDDVEALCRSGSSNKQRGSTTIGYRGIGFKSVVNLASKISVFSGDFNFCFDRDKTKRSLQNDGDVPLIRVPHPIDESHNILRNQAFELIREYHYKTVFVFQDVMEEMSLQELSSFDRSSLLFLNNLRSVLINFQNINRTIIVENIHQHQRGTIKIIEGENTDEWEVETANANNIDRVAFKKAQGSIVPALKRESVIHSFTPTHEFAGAYIKINGDFTTDPSRKTVDVDELSRNSFNNAISIIVGSITSILNGDLTRKGFFSPFVSVQVTESSQFKPLLFKSIEAGLQKSEIITTKGTKENVSSIRLKPEWLNYEDYERLCHDAIASISKDSITTYPELFSFLNTININTLSLEEIIQRINVTKISITGCAQIFEKIIKQYRYDLDYNKIEKLRDLKIFPVNNSFVQADQIRKATEIAIEFRNYLNSNSDPADIAMFFKKFGIEPETPTDNNILTDKTQNQTIQQPQVTLHSGFKTEPAIKKWRSAEQNAAEYLKSLNIVLSVKDVTQANLGYDLEVMLMNGKRIYIEIKSVSSFSEPFKISNNEYSSAHSYGRDYYIALVINDEPFKMKFVPDPIKTLSFEKKCEKWSWFCEQYSGDLKEVTQIFL
ncbi:MAG: DUF3883 domain-containing protein [Ginsengibacter sp.]